MREPRWERTVVLGLVLLERTEEDLGNNQLQDDGV